MKIKIQPQPGDAKEKVIIECTIEEAQTIGLALSYHSRTFINMVNQTWNEFGKPEEPNTLMNQQLVISDMLMKIAKEIYQVVGVIE